MNGQRESQWVKEKERKTVVHLRSSLISDVCCFHRYDQKPIWQSPTVICHPSVWRTTPFLSLFDCLVIGMLSSHFVIHTAFHLPMWLCMWENERRKKKRIASFHLIFLVVHKEEAKLIPCCLFLSSHCDSDAESFSSLLSVWWWLCVSLSPHLHLCEFSHHSPPLDFFLSSHAWPVFVHLYLSPNCNCCTVVLDSLVRLSRFPSSLPSCLAYINQQAWSLPLSFNQVFPFPSIWTKGSG